MIICDTREKKNGHILEYFDMVGIEYKIAKLDTADYCLEGDGSIVIDRKQNLDELARNLCNRKDQTAYS